MSKKCDMIEVRVPERLTAVGATQMTIEEGVVAQELLVSRGHTCRYCGGTGWAWGEDERGELVKRDCPVCGGSGELDAEVVVRWLRRQDVRKAIHSIYKNKELDKSKTMLYVRQPDGVSLDTYSIEFVIAIAFRIRSSGSIRFRKFITDRMCSRNGNSSVSLFISATGKSTPWYN